MLIYVFTDKFNPYSILHYEFQSSMLDTVSVRINIIMDIHEGATQHQSSIYEDYPQTRSGCYTCNISVMRRIGNEVSVTPSVEFNTKNMPCLQSKNSFYEIFLQVITWRNKSMRRTCRYIRKAGVKKMLYKSSITFRGYWHFSSKLKLFRIAVIDFSCYW